MIFIVLAEINFKFLTLRIDKAKFLSCACVITNFFSLVCEKSNIELRFFIADLVLTWDVP